MKRIAWLDICKGLGIVMVIVYHTFEGIQNTFSDSPFIEPITQYFRIWLMPMFFIVSGMVASFGINSDPRKKQKSKVFDWIYIYIIWSFIIYAVRFLSNSITNTKMEASEILYILWDPVPTIWFIYALLLCYLFAVLFRSRNPTLLLLIAFCANGFNSLTFGLFPETILQRFAWILIFYILGAFYSHSIIELIRSKYSIILAISFLMVAPIAAIYREFLSFPILPVLSIYLSLGFISMVYLISQIVSSYFLLINKWLAYLGSISIFIYLTHFPFPAFSRILLLKFNSYSMTTNVIFAVILSLIIGILAAKLSPNKLFNWLFYRPRLNNKK